MEKRTRVGIRGPHSSLQHTIASSWVHGCMLTATTSLHSSSPSISIQEKATRKRRCMAAVTATQASWRKMEVTSEVSSGHNLP